MKIRFKYQKILIKIKIQIIKHIIMLKLIDYILNRNSLQKKVNFIVLVHKENR